MQKRKTNSFFVFLTSLLKTKNEFVFRFSYFTFENEKRKRIRFSFANLKTKNEKGIRYPFFVRKFENEKGKNGINTDPTGRQLATFHERIVSKHHTVPNVTPTTRLQLANRVYQSTECVGIDHPLPHIQQPLYPWTLLRLSSCYSFRGIGQHVFLYLVQLYVISQFFWL